MVIFLTRQQTFDCAFSHAIVILRKLLPWFDLVVSGMLDGGIPLRMNLFVGYTFVLLTQKIITEGF